MSLVNRLTLSAASAGALALGSAPSAAFAGGFYLQEQSVKGLGRAYSGEAADVGPESLWWNPATIAEVQGVEVYGGANVVISDSSVTDHGSTIDRPGQPPSPVGGVSPSFNPLQAGVVPNFDAAWRVNEHISLGLAVSAPFDFTTRYSTASFARYQALTSKLFDIDLQPTIALHLNRYVDIGAGFDVQDAQSTLSSALPNLSPLLPDGFNQLRGQGWDFGWTVGAQLHPTARLSIGGSYRSQIDHQLSGSALVEGLLGPLAGQNGVLPATARFSTPWIAVVGARYSLNDRWTLNAQVQEVGWSVFDAIRIQTAAGPTVIPQGYHDTTTGAVGVDYLFRPNLTLRAGVAYDPTPTPDVGRSTRVPDGNRWLFTVGGSLRPSPKLELDAALAYVDLQSARVVSDATAFSGTPVVTPIAYNAVAMGDAIILSAGAKYKF
jgi:long-chain fatty acid transport protein